jgi:hypothetical protein
MTGISSHPGAAPGYEAPHTPRDQAVERYVLGEPNSRRLRGEVIEEFLSLFAREEDLEPAEEGASKEERGKKQEENRERPHSELKLPIKKRSGRATNKPWITQSFA